MESAVKITIKNLTYEVLLVSPKHEDLQTDEVNRIILGRAMNLEQRILIRKDLSPNRMLNVLIHEITHVFIDLYGYSEMGTWNEEQLCSFNEAFASDIVSLANEVFKKLA